MKIFPLPQSKESETCPPREDMFWCDVPVTAIPGIEDRAQFSNELGEALVKLSKDVNEAIKNGATGFEFFYINIRDSIHNQVGDKGAVLGIAHKAP